MDVEAATYRKDSEYIKNNIKVLVIHVNCMKKHDGSFETR